MTNNIPSFQLDSIRYDTDEVLGEGGTAEVYRCVTPDGQHRVLKLYREEDLDDVDVDALRDNITWPSSLCDEDRTVLGTISAWPQALVLLDEAVVGIILPEAPGKYFMHHNGVSKPRHLVRLAVTKEEADKKGYEYFDFPHKIARLGHVLAGLQFLHDIGIVVGDLQFNNLLTTGLSPFDGEIRCEVYFLDCDSFIIDGRAGLANRDPLLWRPDEASDGFSTSLDLFKFALMVIRSLSERTNHFSIAFSDYRELLPSADFRTLQEILTARSQKIATQDLSAMARAWQSSVRNDGRMYRRTDEYAHQKWTPQIRATHLQAVASAASNVGGVPGTESVTTSSPQLAQSKPDLTPTYPPPSTGRRRTRLTAALVVAAMTALLGFIWLAMVFHFNLGAESSTPTAPSAGFPTTSTTTAQMTTTTTPAQMTRATAPAVSPPVMTYPVRSARVGDCIHRELGAPNGDGSYKVDVYTATCGTNYATDRITKVGSSTSNCGSAGWIMNASPTVIVLCLAPDVA
ncbi:hypothetical protein ACWDTI_21460 [Gordonia sp. NPDC003424]